jgi:hypothetical protein
VTRRPDTRRLADNIPQSATNLTPEEGRCGSLGDQVGHLGWAFQDEQVAAAVDDLRPGPEDVAGEHPAV